MLCLPLFPTFTPSNFVRVIDSSVPCALAFWLCFVTPHLYQLACFQLGGLSNLKKKEKTNPSPASSGALWHGSPLPCPLSPGPSQAMPWCLCRALCSSSTLSPGSDGAQGRAATDGHGDGDRGRASTPGSFCSGRAGPALALISGTSRAPLSLRQHQGSSRECRVGGAAMYK